MLKDMKDHIETLIVKARNAGDVESAIGFSQAALNVASIFQILYWAEADKRRSVEEENE